ncbi:MAG: peptidoglycan-binding protein [Flavobacteriaceae bacterium]|nr:peptidoglycan-binding protein [Flavobacteriaceae bacterium]
MYEINAFVANFLKYLDDLAQEEKKTEEEKEPEISEEEQLRLAVIEIQKLLNAAGCNAGVADGIWGRRTQAAAVLFAKTAKLPTEKKQLISDSFIQQLRLAPSGFCPKPKINKTSASASLAGLWSARTDCNGNKVIKGAGFAKYKSRTGSTEHYSITYSNEWYHYPLVKISNSRWQGKPKSGCQITFSR